LSGRITIDRAIPVHTRDGVLLATDVYRPEGNGPFPTLVYRVRGGRSSAFIAGVLLLNPFDAVERGYAVVIQEVRGRAASDDRWHPFAHERDDSEDCLDWVVAQPWCDGRVGTYGTAYSAVGALQMAALGRDEVKAVAVLGTGADYHDGWIYTSGAFELGWNVYWVYMTLKESIARLDVDDDTRADLARRHSQAIIDAPEMAARLPLRDHPLLVEVGDTQFHEWLDHPDYDEFWERVDVLASAHRIGAPILSLVGWWDNFLSSHFDLYRAITDVAPEPGRSHHRLVVGPWEHCNYVMGLSTNNTGDVEFGTSAACGVAVSGPMVLDWFDRWLLGRDTGAAGGVRYWQLGVDEWREVDAWPPAHREVRWYLDSSGAANTADGDGVLTTDVPADDRPSDTYRYDPADPTPTVGGKTLMPTIQPAGIFDRADVERRADVLCYTSAPLDDPIELAGRVRVELWASSSAVDTDFTAHLVDVSPAGYCTGLAEGIVRARTRASTRERSPALVPGAPTEFSIDLWDLAHTFLPGHRIRVEISSSNFPRFDRNLNTARGADPSVPYGSESLEDAIVADQVVMHTATHPSCVVLPVRT
jgi:putative CocE/NonD family hydrolase